MNVMTTTEMDLGEKRLGRTYNSIVETVGNTPLVRINRLAEEYGCVADVFAKLEFFNPLSSVKDRIAVSMIEAMEADGTVGPGSIIVEPTAGNTGIGLAFVCAARGYRCVLVMPDSFSIERRKLIRFLGAELVLTPKEQGIKGATAKAEEIVATTDKAVMPFQFSHPANPGIHRQTTASEIWHDTAGQVDAVVIASGTGGTLTGVAERLKQLKPEVRIVAVEPENSAILSGGSPGPHMIQGVGPGFVPENLNTDMIDSVETVSNEEALETARKLALYEGIPAGISSGAALACTLRVAKRPEMKGKTVVTILASGAERYLSTALFEGYGED